MCCLAIDIPEKINAENFGHCADRPLDLYQLFKVLMHFSQHKLTLHISSIMFTERGKIILTRKHHKECHDED